MKTNGRSLWTVLAIVAVVFLVHGLVQPRASFLLSDIGLDVLDFCVGVPLTGFDFVVGVVFLLLVIIGSCRGWGPLVSCTLLGVIAAELLAALLSPTRCAAHVITVAYIRAVQNDISVLLLGAAFGAVIGMRLDWRRVGTLPVVSSDRKGQAAPAR